MRQGVTIEATRWATGNRTKDGTPEYVTVPAGEPIDVIGPEELDIHITDVNERYALKLGSRRTEESDGIRQAFIRLRGVFRYVDARKVRVE